MSSAKWYVEKVLKLASFSLNNYLGKNIFKNNLINTNTNASNIFE